MIRFFKFIIFTASFFIVSCKNTPSAQPATAVPVKHPLHDTIAHFIDSLLNNSGFSGNVLVAQKGQIIYEHSQGYEDAGQTMPITPETPLHVASTSKTFTATAIFQLIEQGKISLQDSLQQFFPNFPCSGITVRHLLTHTSGLQNYAYFLPALKWNKKVTASNEDVLNTFISKKPPMESRVGSRFNYCNFNFSLLALIVEKVSGRYFPDYVQDSIFARCGMHDSYIVGIKDTAGFKVTWTPSGRPYNFDYLDAVYGDKNVFTTCRDLLKYDSAIYHHVLLQQSSYDSMWQPLNPDRHYRDTVEYYGMGWRIKDWKDGRKIVYHNGWWHGSNSMFQRLINDSAVLICIGNRFNSRIYSMRRLANIFSKYYADVKPEEDPEPAGDSTKPSATSKKQPVPVKKPVVKSKPQKRRK